MAMLVGGRGLKAEMNVTPMVDVLLVLLVIFMITPRPDKAHGIDTKVPQPVNQQQTPAIETTIVLQVMQGPGVTAGLRLNREEVTWSNLSQRLRDIYKTRATKVIFIRGDKQVEFIHVVHAMDLAREADPLIAIGFLGKDAPAD
jgi:biopolymer transport protein TolR